MYYETRKLIYWMMATIGAGFGTVAYSVDAAITGGGVGPVVWLPALVGFGAAALDAHAHRKSSDAPEDVVVSDGASE